MSPAIFASRTLLFFVGVVAIFASFLAIEARAGDKPYALDLSERPYRLVQVIGEKNGELELYESGSGQKYTRPAHQVTVEAAKGEAVDGIKRGDVVKFEVTKTVGGRSFRELHASPTVFVFRNGLTWVRESDPECRFECRPKAWIVHSEHLVKEVPASKDGVKAGDEVCLVKKYHSWSEGSCGTVIRVFSNGDLQVNTFSLFGLRERWKQHDLDLPGEWFKKREPAPVEDRSIPADEPRGEAVPAQ